MEKLKYLLPLITILISCKSNDTDSSPSSNLFNSQLKALKINDSSLENKNKKWQKSFGDKYSSKYNKYSYKNKQNQNTQTTPFAKNLTATKTIPLQNKTKSRKLRPLDKAPSPTKIIKNHTTITPQTTPEIHKDTLP